MRFRLLLPATLAVALLTPGTAGATSLAESNPPTAAGLAAVDAKVTWPLTAGAAKAAPGKRYTVRVHRGSARVTVSLVRVDRRLRPVRMVARRTLRRGTFIVRIPETPVATYALRLRTGGRTFFNWIIVGADHAPIVQQAPAPAPAPAPQPAPVPPPSPCPADDPARAAASLAGGPPTGPVAPGSRIDLAVTNAGPTCLAGTEPTLLRETAPGAWETVEQRDAQGRPIAYPAILVRQPSGATRAVPAFIPPDASPGSYRIEIPVVFLSSSWQMHAAGSVVSQPFTVAAP